MKDFIIIVAGGSGTRFGSATPKQFLPLNGRPVLMHTIERFDRACSDRPHFIRVVLPEDHIATWEALCKQHDFTVPHRVVMGGATRFHSVKNALSYCDYPHPDALILIHDGVRPLVSDHLILLARGTAARYGSAVPVVPVTDSVRQLDADGGSHIVDRSTLRAVQTPQCFNLEKLQKAYAQPYNPLFTDDASVYESMYHEPVALFDGDPKNIKITHPADLAVAEMLMQNE